MRSPLRYPGGKSRAIDQIMPLVPATIADYREPFIGGGSVFFAIRAAFGVQPRYALNDLNADLIHFWRAVRDNADRLAEAVTGLRAQYADDGRALHAWLKDETRMHSDFDRAVRFFIMNRITFSGVMDAGGYSQQAFQARFTASSIARLRDCAPALAGVELTLGDYAPLLLEPGQDVFVFLDPPYWSATESKLYGKGGALHTGFDHERFADTCRRSPHRWLITYDDSPRIRDLFAFAEILPWELQYGMNNFRQTRAAKGKELFIRNY